MADAGAITVEGKRLSKRFDSATGRTVRENVIKAYRFLVSRYRPGDNLFLFGFSRGAYTIKALAGMINFLGMAQPELENLAPLAWSLYSDDDASLKLSNRFQGGARFKKCFAVEERTRIHFVGLWDAVSSFGAFWNFRTLPFTADNPSIGHIRHALAIDERRAFFKPNLFRPSASTQHASFKQVWFAGAHCDVGGGNAELDDSLAKVALKWMIDEAKEQGLKTLQMQLDEIYNGEKKSHPNPLGKLNESLQGTWLLAELLPYRTFDHNANSVSWNPPNFGRRRFIEEGSTLHASVVARQNDSQLNYHPANLPTTFSVEP